MTAIALNLSKTAPTGTQVTHALPEVPLTQWTDELREFDQAITDEEVVAEAEKVVVTMLAYRFSDGVFSRTINERQVDTPCETDVKTDEGETADMIFFPDFPEEEDFEPNDAPSPESYIGGSANPEYHSDYSDHKDGIERLNAEFNRLYDIAEIRTARSKQICSSCPLRQVCLTNSIISDDMSDESSANDWNEYGIFGGWGENARALVRDETLAILLAYDNDDMDEKEIERLEVSAVEMMNEKNIPFSKERGEDESDSEEDVA